MKELKLEIDDLEHKKVITAYFDNSEDRHGFLYLRIETVANFAGLQFKEDGGAFFLSKLLAGGRNKFYLPASSLF